MFIKGSYGRTKFLGIKQDYNVWQLETDPILYVSNPKALHIFFVKCESVYDTPAISTVNYPVKSYKYPRDFTKPYNSTICFIDLTKLIRKHGVGAYFLAWVNNDDIIPSGQQVRFDSGTPTGATELTPFCSFNSSIGEININKGFFVNNPKLNVLTDNLSLNKFQTTYGT